MSGRQFELPEDRGVVTFTQNVLNHIYQHAQTSIWSKEAGGQLFSTTLSTESVDISVVTGPHKQDRRTRTSFAPDVKIAVQDRLHQFENGFHPVGLWHTHPEKYPTPSQIDKETTQAYLRSFNGEMDGFLLAILGNHGNPFNLTLWLAWPHSSPLIQLPEIFTSCKD
jgi:integrative and conjugative element protein (TIGR02256 family)